MQGTETLISHRELAEILVKHYGLRDGIYDVSFEFQIGVGSIGPEPNAAQLPSAIVSISRVGLKKVNVAGPSTVDAAAINLTKLKTRAPANSKSKSK